MRLFRLRRLWRIRPSEAEGDGAAPFEDDLVVAQYRNHKAYEDLRAAMDEMMELRNRRRREGK